MKVKQMLEMLHNTSCPTDCYLKQSSGFWHITKCFAELCYPCEVFIFKCWPSEPLFPCTNACIICMAVCLSLLSHHFKTSLDHWRLKLISSYQLFLDVKQFWSLAQNPEDRYLLCQCLIFWEVRLGRPRNQWTLERNFVPCIFHWVHTLSIYP